MPDPDPTKKANYSYAVQARETLQIFFPLAQTWIWDSFWRGVYNKANLAIDPPVRRGSEARRVAVTRCSTG